MEQAVVATAESTALTRSVEYTATGIELLAVAIITAVIFTATVFYLFKIIAGRADGNTYRNYRHGVARALLLGLEILVAADVIRTVALEPTAQNVLILGLLVLIRTFLGWSLVIEIEERWPWQPLRTGEIVKSLSILLPKLDRKCFQTTVRPGSVSHRLISYAKLSLRLTHYPLSFYIAPKSNIQIFLSWLELRRSMTNRSSKLSRERWSAKRN